MIIDIITIFPEAFTNYFDISIIKRAREKGLVDLRIHNLRQWTKDRHQTVDDSPYGGGAGLIFLVEPIYRAVRDLKKKVRIKKEDEKNQRRIILFSVKGKKFNQAKAEKLKNYKHLILICPRYEGVDERVAKYLADEEISIGDYILTGGELPAMVVVDAVCRLIGGVIKKESLKEESFYLDSTSRIGSTISRNYEYPQYSRPEIFYPNSKQHKVAWRVPKVLLSGNHRAIAEWRKKHIKKSSSLK